LKSQKSGSKDPWIAESLPSLGRNNFGSTGVKQKAVVCMKSQNGARPKPMMSARLAASVVLIVLGLLSEVVVRSTHFQGAAVSNASGGSQNPERRNTGGGIIAGVVVNERRDCGVESLIRPA